MTTAIRTNIPDNKSKVYGGAWSVHEPQLVETRGNILRSTTGIDLTNKSALQDIKAEFLDVYKKWMFKDFPGFQGTELYTEACVTQATTESFAQFYLRYGGSRRLRIAQGEYFYHQMMKNLGHVKDFAWLGQEPLDKNDFVLISVPFSDTGATPDGLEDLLTQCDRLGVPVMLDLAYINLTKQEYLGTLDLSHDCIEYIVSSLSKALPLEHFRIGIRLQKKQYEDQLYVINEDNYNYLNFSSVYLGMEMMKVFPASDMIDTYRPIQEEQCALLDISPSPCYIFGIDTKNLYPEYNRGGATNRLCFSRVWDSRV